MKSLLLLATFIFALHAFPQKKGQALLDSMLQALPSAKEDTNKVKLLLSISQLYTTVSPKEGFAYANTGMKLAEKLQWKRGIANLYNCFGLMTHDTGNAAAAIVYFEKSFAINKALDAKPFMIANMSNIGRSYQRETNFTKASEYYFKALEIAEESNNDEQAALLGTNITALYITQGDYVKASKYAELTIKKGTAANTLIHVSKAYEMLGVIKLETKDTIAAKENFNKALAIDEKLDNKMAVVSVLSNLGTAEGDLVKQLITFLKVQKILDDIAPASQNSIVNLANLGLTYYNLGMSKKGTERTNNFDSSEIYFKRAIDLCVSTGNPGYKSEIQQAISSLEEAKGNYKDALKDYKDFTTFNDSVFSQENKNKIAALESQRAIDLKNREIENKQLQIGNQQKKMWLLISFVAFLGIVGALLYRQNITREKNNAALLKLNNELDEANKVKAKFFGIISHDLRSPVANLLNFLELQKRRPGLMSEISIAEREQKISASANSLLETMETMLLWSKEQMESFKPNIKSVTVENLFSYIKKSFGDTPDVELRFNAAAGLTILTDENYLRTIMQNLTSNAIRAVKNTPVAIIEWAAIKENNGLVFTITDNGEGIKATQANVLFEKNVASNEKHGFGLHLVRDLAKAIQYKITVDSVQGVGTTFKLSPVNG